MTAIANTTANTLNGLPLAELGAIPGALAEAPEQGILSFETHTKWLGGLRSRSQVEACEVGGERIARRHSIEADEPTQIFGTDSAPNPQELWSSTELLTVPMPNEFGCFVEKPPPPPHRSSLSIFQSPCQNFISRVFSSSVAMISQTWAGSSTCGTTSKLSMLIR